MREHLPEKCNKRRNDAVPGACILSTRKPKLCKKVYFEAGTTGLGRF